MGNSVQVDTVTRRIADRAIGYGAVQKRTELAEFLSLLVDLKPNVIVEIGVHAGGTMYAWSQVASDPYGVDTTPSSPELIYTVTGGPRDEHGATIIIGNSHDSETLAALREELNGRPVDVLFIDGDHSYEGVRQDYEMYRSLVRPGGLIAFHDIVTVDPSCGVPRLWAEIGTAGTEIVHPQSEWFNTGRPLETAGGIGVLTCTTA